MLVSKEEFADFSVILEIRKRRQLLSRKVTQRTYNKTNHQKFIGPQVEHGRCYKTGVSNMDWVFMALRRPLTAGGRDYPLGSRIASLFKVHTKTCRGVMPWFW